MDGIHGPLAARRRDAHVPAWPFTVLLLLGAAVVASAVWPDLEPWFEAGTWVLGGFAVALVAVVLVLRLAAIGKALAARRRCPQCDRDAGYTIPTSLGRCLDCEESAVTKEMNAA